MVSSSDKSLVSVLIDGDGAIFVSTLLARGREGGREAAMLLRQSVGDYARRVMGREPSRIVCYAYVNATDLGRVLENTETASLEAWSEFQAGFNQAHPLFSLVDCGRGKEGADSKMREAVKMFATLSSCGLVLFAGTHDNGYVPCLQSLATEGVLNKVHLLGSYSDMPIDIRSLKLPVHTIEGLFMAEVRRARSNAADAPETRGLWTTSTAEPDQAGLLSQGLAPELV